MEILCDLSPQKCVVLWVIVSSWKWVTGSLEMPLLPACCEPRGDKPLPFWCNVPTPALTNKSLVNENPPFTWTAPNHLVSGGKSLEFRLWQTSLRCLSGLFLLDLPMQTNKSFDKTDDYFLPTSHLRFNHEYYGPDEFCISGITRDKLKLEVCRADCNHPKTPCVQKCCGLDEVYSFGSPGKGRGCIPLKPGGLEWTPKFYEKLNERLKDQGMLRPHVVQRFPTSFKNKCKNNKTTIYPFGEKVANFLTILTGKQFHHLQFQIRKDGALINPYSKKISSAVSIDSYCTDGAQDFEPESIFKNDEADTIMFSCSGGLDEVLREAEPKPLMENMPKRIVPKSSGGISPPKGVGKRPLMTSSGSEIHIKIPDQETYASMDSNTLLKRNNINEEIKGVVKFGENTFLQANNSELRLNLLPACCHFPGNLNDERIHRCRDSERVLESPFLGNPRIKPSPGVWNVPAYFLSSGRLDRSFRFTTRPLKCTGGRFQFQGFIHDFVQNQAKGYRKTGILPNGILKHNDEFYSPEHYCINGFSKRIVELLICKPNCAQMSTVCVQKCCGPDEIYSLGLRTGKRGCQPLHPNDKDFTPASTSENGKKLEKRDVHFIQSYPPEFQSKCYNNMTLAFPYSALVANKLTLPGAREPFKYLRFRLDDNGRLVYLQRTQFGEMAEIMYEKKEYCIDGIRDYGESSAFSNAQNETILFICASRPRE